MAQGNRIWMPSSIFKNEVSVHFSYMTVVFEQKDLGRNIVFDTTVDYVFQGPPSFSLKP